MSYGASPREWGSGDFAAPGTSYSDMERHRHKHSSHKHKRSKHSEDERSSSHHKHKHRSHSHSTHKAQQEAPESSVRPDGSDTEQGEVEEGELIDMEDFKVKDEWVDVEEGEICYSPGEVSDDGEFEKGASAGHTSSRKGRAHSRHSHKKHKKKHSRSKDERRMSHEVYSMSEAPLVSGDYPDRNDPYVRRSYDPRMEYDDPAYYDSKGRSLYGHHAQSRDILRHDHVKRATLMEDRGRVSSHRDESPYRTGGYFDTDQSRRGHSERWGSSSEVMTRQSGAMLLEDRDNYQSYDDRYMIGKRSDTFQDDWTRMRKSRGSERDNRPVLKEDGAIVHMERPLLREDGAVIRERFVTDNRGRKDRPILKENGAFVSGQTFVRDDRIMDIGRKNRPVLKEDGARVRQPMPELREDGAIVRKKHSVRDEGPVLKEDGTIVRKSRPILKEDGAVVSEDWPDDRKDHITPRVDRPVLKENGSVVRDKRPVLKEDGAIIRDERSSREDIEVRRDRPVLKEDGAIITDNTSGGRDNRPILKEDGAVVDDGWISNDDRESVKDVRRDRPVLKENGEVVRNDRPLREDGPVMKEDRENVRSERPVLREDGTIVRENRSLGEKRPILKEDGEIVRNDRPVLREDGAIVREDRPPLEKRPVLKQDGEIVRPERPILREDGAIVREDRPLSETRPILKEDGEIVRNDRPILREDGAIVREDRPLLEKRPVLKEDGEIVRAERPTLREDGAIVRKDRHLSEKRTVLKKDGDIFRNDRPILREDGTIVREDKPLPDSRPVLKEDGAIVRDSRPVLREDGTIVRQDKSLPDSRPVLKEDGAIVRDARPVLKEDGAIVKEDKPVPYARPVLKEDGAVVRDDRPIHRKEGAIIREERTVSEKQTLFKEDEETIRNSRAVQEDKHRSEKSPVLKEGQEMVMADLPVLGEDGTVVKEDGHLSEKRTVLNEDREVKRKDKPVLKDEAIISEIENAKDDCCPEVPNSEERSSKALKDKPVVVDQSPIHSDSDRLVLSEDGEVVTEDRMFEEEISVLKEGEIIAEDRTLEVEEIVSEEDFEIVEQSKTRHTEEDRVRRKSKSMRDARSSSKELTKSRSALKEHHKRAAKKRNLERKLLKEKGTGKHTSLHGEGDAFFDGNKSFEDIQLVCRIHDDQPVLDEGDAVVRDSRSMPKVNRPISRKGMHEEHNIQHVANRKRNRTALSEDRLSSVDRHLAEEGEYSDSTTVSCHSKESARHHRRHNTDDRNKRERDSRRKTEDKHENVDADVSLEWTAAAYHFDGKDYDRPLSEAERADLHLQKVASSFEDPLTEDMHIDLYPDGTAASPYPGARGHHGKEGFKRPGIRGQQYEGHDVKKKSGSSLNIAVQKVRKRESIRNARAAKNDLTYSGTGGKRRYGLSSRFRDEEPVYKRRRRRTPSPEKEKPCIRSCILPEPKDQDELVYSEYTAPIAAWVRSSAADLYFQRDMQNPRCMKTTKRQQDLERKFEHDLVERASRIIAALPPDPKPENPEWLKHRHCKHSKHQVKPNRKSGETSSSSDSETDDDSDSEQWWLDEMKRKQEHPRRLHPELWYNDPQQLNYEPLCRCSQKARKTGIRHNKYPGEEPIPKCDVTSNNLDKLFHYKITVSPVTNFLTKHPSVIVFDGREYMFEGFSIFTHQEIPKMPPCEVIRFNIVYTIHVLEEQPPENFSIRSLDLITQFLYDEILELVDIDWKGPGGDDHCNIFHVMPRFARPFPENGKEIMSINDILLYLLKSSKPLVDKEDLVRLRWLDKEAWQKYMDEFQYMVVTNPAKKPRSIRIDQLDRTETERDASIFPLIVHKGLRPALLSYAGDPAYRKKWREYLKFRQLLWTRVKLSEEDKFKLEDMQMELQRIRIKCTMKKDVLVAVGSEGFMLTGIRSDLCQHAMLLPVLFGHVRFHLCLKSFQKIIKYQFKDIELLQLAFTHSSYKVNYGTNPDHGRNSLSNCGSRQLEFGDLFVHTTNRRKKGLCVLLHIMSKMAHKDEVKSDIPHNERLEFLGDAVLEFITSTHLFSMFPNCDEGDLSTFRGALVQNAHLSVLANKLRLQDYLLYAHGPDLCHESDLKHAMANCFEAIMGAMYLDGGIELADRVFAETLFDDPELLDIWMNVPKHPLQEEEPKGDRHWIANSPSLKKLLTFEKDIGYEFQHIRVLARAFTQRAIGYNHLTKGHNQTLEFLGDTIMQLMSSDFLYRHFPDHHEGHLTLLRSSLVSNRTQATMAGELGLMNYVITQRVSNKAPKVKEKADIFEAVLAALYVDGGLEPCKVLLHICCYPRLEMFIVNLQWNDPKSQLQQFCLTLRDIKDETPDIPEYKVVNVKGPTHKRIYRVAVYFRGRRLAVGIGKSKQQGEMNAAMKALRRSKELFPNQVSIEDKMMKMFAPYERDAMR